MTEEIGIEIQDGVLTLSLRRPAQRNALNLAMYEALASALEHAAENPELRAILIHGEGGAFTSGNDLNDFASAAFNFDEGHPLIRFMHGLYLCPLPVVAAVEGVAVGIGTTLLLHCDFVYAHPDAVFQLPFVNLGLCPEYASSLFLPQRAGHVRAAELLMLGEKFSAQEAERCALLNAVVEHPLEIAQATCAKLAKKAPEAIKITKALLKSPMKEQGLKVMQEEGALFLARLKSAEFSEAVTAFFEKREADFSKLNSK